MANANETSTPAQNLIRFNIRNAKYAFPLSDGSYGDFVSMGTSTKMALEVDASEKEVYGDGECIIYYVNEKGKTGTLTQNNICNAYEIACGRKIMLENGLADVKPTKNTPHVIYFEICEMDGDNQISVAKCMLYGVTSTRPSENYDQNNGDINESSFDTTLKIKGIDALAADGGVYIDAKGNTCRVWQLVKTPDMEGYGDFGKTVVIPKKLAETTSNA